METRGEKIQSVLNRLNGTKTQDLYFRMPMFHIFRIGMMSPQIYL